MRAEEVDFFGYRSPAPADYLAASGYHVVVLAQAELPDRQRRFDNRNSPFMPTKGQYLQLSTEQGWGSFTWTKFDAEGRVYLPTCSRPDGTGKQFFTFRGHFGIATEIDTRSTSGTSRVTSAACADSSIERSARTPSAFPPAAS